MGPRQVAFRDRDKWSPSRSCRPAAFGVAEILFFLFCMGLSCVFFSCFRWGKKGARQLVGTAGKPAGLWAMERHHQKTYSDDRSDDNLPNTSIGYRANSAGLTTDDDRATRKKKPNNGRAAA
ncbi:hypothetical protein TW95_gp0721 [Pandoravirus inopinatum]|uniref:Uncharacterized protein n=1 Tax=Pandoravirus inopinatum TaxID=1605721 RepID=A0A0B5J6Q3_9VIRU|nr:hypothetical protein TW95_gp0721 [Pandoravirus inopinatum]AJF97455.1 hypothetical protein [Pandoravirus inopinatum]